MTKEYYQLRGQYYLGDGVYLWENLEQCKTLEKCIQCRSNAMMHYPEYVDYEIIHRIETVVMTPQNDIESDMDR